MTWHHLKPALGTGLALAVCCMQSLAQPAPAPVKGQTPPLPASRVAAPAASQIDATAIRVLLLADAETTLSSTVAAKVSALNGALGQSFKAGDILISFDCEEAIARLEMSKAELAGAVDQHEAKVRMQGLGQASEVEVAVAASVANKAKAQMSLNQVQVAQCNIRAPWSGRVARVNVRSFMTINPGNR